MEFPLPLRTAIEQKAQDSSTAELIRESTGALSALSRRKRTGQTLGHHRPPGVCLRRCADARYLWRGSRGAGTHASLFGRRAHLSSGCRRRYRRRSLGGGLPAVVGIGFLPGTGARYGPAGPIIDVRRQRTAAKSPLDPGRSHRQKSAPCPRRTGECGLCA